MDFETIKNNAVNAFRQLTVLRVIVTSPNEKVADVPALYALVALLMRLPERSPRVQAAIDGGVAWLRSAAIHDRAWTSTPGEGRKLMRAFLRDGLGSYEGAHDDLPGDLKKHRYNPLAALHERVDYEPFMERLLTMTIAECTAEFEKLPLVQDINILRNILYSGVWSKYAILQKKKESARKEKDHE